NERSVPRRFGHFGRMGTIADIHDHDRDPRRSFHRRVAARVSCRKVVTDLRHRVSNGCYRAARTQQSLSTSWIATEEGTLTLSDNIRIGERAPMSNPPSTEPLDARIAAPLQTARQPRPKLIRPIVVIGAGGIVRAAHLPAYEKAGFPVIALMD